MFINISLHAIKHRLMITKNWACSNRTWTSSPRQNKIILGGRWAGLNSKLFQNMVFYYYLLVFTILFWVA